MRSPLFLAVALAACGQEPYRPRPHVPVETVRLSCTPADCPGCCLNGVCINQASDDLCGGGGAQCFACPQGQVCGLSRFCEPFKPSQTIEAAACPLVLESLPLELPRTLTDVWVGPDVAWAVGPTGALVLESGALKVPKDDAAIGVGLRAVWSTPDGKDVWIVRENVQAAIFHLRGAVATDEPSPTGEPLFAVWGRRGDDVWVGGGGLEHGQLAHWDGTAWSAQTVAGAAVLAIGGADGIGPYLATPAEILVVEGTRVRSLGGTPGYVGAMYVAEGRELYLGGVDGEMHHWQNGKWDSLWVSEEPIGKLWGQGNQHVFLPMPRGGITFFDGDSFSPLPVRGALNAMSGIAAASALAVGDGVAVSARCATPAELLLPYTPIAGTGTPGSSTGGGYCFEICRLTGQWGCLSTATVCF